MQLHEALIEVGELAHGKRAHLLAGRATAVALPEDARQFGEREAEREGPPHDAHPVDRGFRIAAITVRAACCGLDHAEAFVVTNRVGTYAAETRQCSRLQ